MFLYYVADVQDVEAVFLILFIDDVSDNIHVVQVVVEHFDLVEVVKRHDGNLRELDIVANQAQRTVRKSKSS